MWNCIPRRQLIAAVLCVALAGCAAYESNPRTAKGAGIGAAAGAGTGAALGGILGGGKGAGQGAAIGAVVGLLGGGLIGHYLDNQAKEMEGILAEQDRLRRNQDQLQVAMTSDLLFSSGSASLLPGGRDKLRQFAGVLNRYPRTTIQVIGHTDSQGTETSNEDLSRRRAHAVADELVADGVGSSRITTLGRGQTQPVATNATREGRALNRRVEIMVNPDESLRAEQGGGGSGGGGGVGGSGEEPR